MVVLTLIIAVIVIGLAFCDTQRSFTEHKLTFKSNKDV